MCRLFRRKPNPHLVDLHEYEHECMKAVRTGKPIWPFPSILAGNWTDEEVALMRDNRNQAQEIYDSFRKLQGEGS